MNASNGLIYIANIKNALIENDPSNKDFYQKNYEKYKQEISQLHSYIQQEIQKIPEAKRMLVTSHDAFAYYGKAYGVRLNALKGISTEAETQTKDMVRVAKAIRESGVPAIFIESTINPQVIQQIARDNNVKIGGELFADSLGEEDSEGGTYLTMLRHNTDVLVKALSRSEMTETKIDSDDTRNGWMIYLILGAIMIGALIFAVKKFGKSTLFKSILGLIDTNAGDITVLENNIEEVRKRVAYVPQKDDVDWSFPATVMDVVLHRPTIWRTATAGIYRKSTMSRG